MKRTIIFSLLLSLSSSMALGQSRVTVQKCKTCNKPLKECQYKGKHPARNSTPQQKKETFLRVNGNSSGFNSNCTNASGCTLVYTVAYNTSDYSLTSSQAWITFSDKKKDSFRVIIEPNRLTRIREGEFTVTAGDKQVKVNVKQIGASVQKATYILLDGSPDDQVINCDGADGCTASYAVSTDTADFSVVGLPSWITLSQKSLTSFTVRVAPNPKHSMRHDFFLVKAGSKQIKIKVNQAGKPRNGLGANSGIQLAVGAGMRVSHTNVSFSGPTVGGIINYGVNNLTDAGSKPNHSAGIGFEAHGHVGIPLSHAFSIVTGLGLSIHNFSNQFYSSNWHYTLDNWNSGYGVKHNSKEKYHLTMLDIPLLAQYCLPVGNNNVSITFKGGPVFSIGLAGKVKVNGQIHVDNENSNGNNTGTYSESTITGSANLFTGEYNFTQRYTAGSSRSYNIQDQTTNPFSRFNFSLRLGADVEIGHFTFGLNYDIGLANLANKEYFTNVSTQIPGFFHTGSPEFRETTRPLDNYKQRVGSFMITVGYIF